MIRLFTGFDQREAAGFHTFVQSVLDNTTVPVAITPLAFDATVQRDGTNNFCYTRFLVPEMCNWSGFAIFADGADMIAKGDLAELWALRDKNFAVQVVKHDYQTKFPRKYLGTEMEATNADYPRKNWSSLMLINCGHIAHFNAREQLRTGTGEFLHRFAWLKDTEIGELQAKWNWLCDEAGVNVAAKMLHFTAGIPAIHAHRNSAHAQEWRDMYARSKETPAQKRIAELASAR